MQICYLSYDKIRNYSSIKDLHLSKIMLMYRSNDPAHLS